MSSLLVSCDETQRPDHQPVGYYRVDSLAATFVVEEDYRGRVRSTAQVRFFYHFEKSPGYARCAVLRSILSEYDVRHRIMDPDLCELGQA